MAEETAMPKHLASLAIAALAILLINDTPYETYLPK